MNEQYEYSNIIESIDINLVCETMRKISQMHAVIQNNLKKDYDYGIIPGTSKPTLLKPGGEKICMLFNLSPEYEFLQTVEDYDKGFFSYNLKCTLKKDGKPVFNKLFRYFISGKDKRKPWEMQFIFFFS